MKATELMCDDIVLHHGNAYKVFGIMGKANGVDLFPVQLRNAEGLILAPLTCFATEIAPIPLTAEILEKNGWEIYYEVGAIYLAIRKDWNLTIVEKKIGGLPYLRIAHNWICNIRHVHELQHALRLCELVDLADNFKV